MVKEAATVWGSQVGRDSFASCCCALRCEINVRWLPRIAAQPTDAFTAGCPKPQVPGHALGACKEAINKAAADALIAYRTHCAAASSSGQLILPEALKLLPVSGLRGVHCLLVAGCACGWCGCKAKFKQPAWTAAFAYGMHIAGMGRWRTSNLRPSAQPHPSSPSPPHPPQLYTLALSKHAVFRTDTRPDVRAAAMWRMLSLPVHRAVPLVYARMVPLHGLLERPQVRRGGGGGCSCGCVGW